MVISDQLVSISGTFVLSAGRNLNEIARFLQQTQERPCMSRPPSKRQKTYPSISQPPPVMDPDDSMTSTTPSSNDAAPADQDFDDETLFPGSKNPPASGVVRPHTPQNDHLNAAAPGELSPPRSQTHEPRSSVTNGTYAMGGDGTTGAGAGAAAADKPMTDQPGMGWKNKKAQEEMQRAWDFVVDRDFSLKEFGDVVMQGKQQRGET